MSFSGACIEVSVDIGLSQAKHTDDVSAFGTPWTLNTPLKLLSVFTPAFRKGSSAQHITVLFICRRTVISGL